MSDQNYRSALTGFTAVVEQVPMNAWQWVSTCPPWTASELVGHLVDGLHQTESLLTGNGPRPPANDLAAIAGADPAGTWRSAIRAYSDVLAKLDVTATVSTPFGPQRVSDLIPAAMIEPLLHAWDLASTIGIRVDLDPGAVHETLIGVRALGDGLAASGMYQPARPVSSDASEQAQLLAATGRDPQSNRAEVEGVDGLKTT